jgi:SAM-dependent methyltransferase
VRVLAQRSVRPELMDSEAVPFEEFRQCLRHLERINRASLAYRPTLAWLDRMMQQRDRAEPSGRASAEPLAILDVGFGHGDMLRRIAAWAERRGRPVRLAGIDLNPWSARAAALATPPGLAIDYHVGDVFAWPDRRPWDLVVSSLFTHHLPDAELVRFLEWMSARASLGWFINDLHRHPLPYGFVHAAARLLPVNRMMKHDAPLSVARSFRHRDWCGLIGRSGLDASQVAIEWWFPFRYCVSFLR